MVYHFHYIYAGAVNSLEMLKMLLCQKMHHILLIGSLCFTDDLILESSPRNYSIEEGMAPLAPFPLFIHLYNIN